MTMTGNRAGFVTAKPSKRKRKYGKGSPDRATASTSRVGGRATADRLAHMQNHASQPLIPVSQAQ